MITEIRGRISLDWLHTRLTGPYTVNEVVVSTSCRVVEIGAHAHVVTVDLSI